MRSAVLVTRKEPAALQLPYRIKTEKPDHLRTMLNEGWR